MHLGDAGASHYILYGVQADSPLAPLIIWDLAHAVPQGCRIGFAGDAGQTPFLMRQYFAQAFTPLGLDERGIDWFEKTGDLAAERDQGLDSWTFGIPVGPEDATILNHCVERILSLDIPNKEILLCGRPGANFKYWDQVRIVGEDIPFPPLRIGAKKNRLAREARYPNLCIIHDRVYLPRNFAHAVRMFGDMFPLTTMQSLWFDDRYNFVPTRYSDVGISHTVKIAPIAGLGRDGNLASPAKFSPSTFEQLEQRGFFTANALRYSENTYPTGSMYLCKKSVWLMFEQSEQLHWIEFEDVEHAYRAVAGGVPTRINPYACTQSMIARPLLNNANYGMIIESPKGAPLYKRLPASFLPALRRKPATKITEADAAANIRKFARKWCVDGDSFAVSWGDIALSRRRIKMMIDLCERLRVPCRQASIYDMLDDFAKLVLGDQIPYLDRHYIAQSIVAGDGNLIDILVGQNKLLAYHLVQRPKRGFFAKSLEQYFVKRSLLTACGTLLSALYLWSHKRSVLYLHGGPIAYLKAIINSTPFEKQQQYSEARP